MMVMMMMLLVLVLVLLIVIAVVIAVIAIVAHGTCALAILFPGIVIVRVVVLLLLLFRTLGSITPWLRILFATATGVVGVCV